MPDEDHEDYLLWRRTVDELLAKGVPMPDAIRVANTTVNAQRKTREEAHRKSGKVPRPSGARGGEPGESNGGGEKAG